MKMLESLRDWLAESDLDTRRERDGGGPDLSRLEEAIMDVVDDLGPAVYGSVLRREVSARLGRKIRAGRMNAALQSLEDQGLLCSRWRRVPSVRRRRRRQEHICAVSPAPLPQGGFEQQCRDDI